MTATRNTWVALATFAIACGGCGSSSHSGSAQGQTHWLSTCEHDSDCGVLACICGVCIAACEPDGACAVDGRETVCQATGSASARALCGQPAPARICLEACGSGCASDERCSGGACVPADRDQPDDPDAEPPGAGSGTGGSDAGPGSNAGTGSLEDGGSTQPDAATPEVDCSRQPIVFPEFDRSCTEATDCAIATRQTNCCGTVIATGVRSDSLASFQQAAGTCASQFPLCGCAASPTQADDGTTEDAFAGTAAATIDCVDGACRTTFGASDLQWFQTCGDPVCGISPDPADDPSIPNCTSQQFGDPCTTEGEQCDGVLSCGASLICTASDPTMRPGGCPISRARFKDEIAYLSERQLHDYHAQVMNLPLASYRYKHAEAAGPQLGFIIDDIEPSVAVSGDHVNMYGYLSMAVAAIQVQQEQITSLQRELERLRAELPAEAAASCEP